MNLAIIIPGFKFYIFVRYDFHTDQHIVRYGNILHMTPGVKGASSGGKTLLIKIWARGFEVSSALNRDRPLTQL